MKKPSVLNVVALIIAVAAIVVSVSVIVHTQNEINCSADKAPAAPAYDGKPDPKTGLVPKDPTHMVKPPAGIFPMGVGIGNSRLKNFFEACHTNYTVRQQTVYIAQDKYNYILRLAGLNENYANGVTLNDDAVASLGLPLDQDTGPKTPPIELQYVLAPTK